MYLAQSIANVSFDSQYLHVLVTDDGASRDAVPISTFYIQHSSDHPPIFDGQENEV